MKRFFTTLGLGLLIVAATQVLPAQNETSEAGESLVVTAEVRGTINPATAHYLARAVSHAEEAKAEILLVELDTPGGLVSSTREIAQIIDRSRVPVVVYVSPGGASATSAGALLMISSHVAAMAPGTNIGAAHPVGTQGEQIEGAAGEKAVNDVAAFARGMAELRGRDPRIAEEVVSKSRSFSAAEARKRNLVEILAPTREDLIRELNGRTVKVGKTETRLRIAAPVRFEPVDMRPGEKLLNWIAHPNIAALLMTLGILLIYAELSAPGLGLPGIAGALCLIVAFIAFQALPIRTGGLLLIALGAALMVAEIFAFSGGILAVGGIVCFLLGLLWVIDPEGGDLRITPAVWALSAGSLIAGGGLIAWAAARTRALSQRALQDAKGGGLGGLEGYVGVVEQVSGGGLAGKALIRGEIWNFQSDRPLAKGDRVEAVSAQGLQIKVKPKE